RRYPEIILNIPVNTQPAFPRWGDRNRNTSRPFGFAPGDGTGGNYTQTAIPTRKHINNNPSSSCSPMRNLPETKTAVIYISIRSDKPTESFMSDERRPGTVFNGNSFTPPRGVKLFLAF